MKLNHIVRNRGLVNIVLCRWGLVLAVAGYFTLFSAELVELAHEPGEVSLMKTVGYGVLLGLVSVKSFRVFRTRGFFGSASETPNDVELH